MQADAVLGAARAADQSSRSSNGLAPIPAVHFFEAKKWFEDMSTVMPLLKAMPKGAALHVRTPTLYTAYAHTRTRTHSHALTRTHAHARTRTRMHTHITYPYAVPFPHPPYQLYIWCV